MRGFSDDVWLRYYKLRDSDREMAEFRSRPEIQRYEAHLDGPRAEPFRYDDKYKNLFRRYDKCKADLFEMIACDEDLA